MTTTKKPLRVDPGKACKDRVKKIKMYLPISYKQIILENFPEYETEKGHNLITYVINLRAADLRLTEILEQIAAGKLKLKIHEFETFE